MLYYGILWSSQLQGRTGNWLKFPSPEQPHNAIRHNLDPVASATEKWPIVEISASVFSFFSTDGQGEWGMTEWDEEEERRRSVKFIDNVIPDTRAQLRVLSKSYQVG